MHHYVLKPAILKKSLSKGHLALQKACPINNYKLLIINFLLLSATLLFCFW